MLTEKYGHIEEEHIPIFESLLKKYGYGIVLDLGCGDINPKGKSKLVNILIEFDIRNSAKKYFSFSPNSLKNTSFIQGDVRKQPFANLSIDLILMLGIYGDCVPYAEGAEYVKKFPDISQSLTEFKKQFKVSQEKLLAETVRVLKKEGNIIVSNSIIRQPIEETIKKFSDYYDITEVYSTDERYLLLGRVIK